MLDAGFLHAEDSDRHVSLAIGALSVLAGPMPDFDSLAAGLAERILSEPRFRQVLRTQPLDLGAPQWVDGHRQLNWGPAESRREDRVTGSGVAPFKLRRRDR